MQNLRNSVKRGVGADTIRPLTTEKVEFELYTLHKMEHKYLYQTDNPTETDDTVLVNDKNVIQIRRISQQSSIVTFLCKTVIL